MASKKYYGDCEGPFGFPMKSEVAKAIEELSKKQNADVKSACSTMIDGHKIDGYCRVMKVAGVPELIDGERADISLVTANSVDRDREVMIPNGADWTNFKKSPMVTFNHDYSALPVGRNMWVQRNKSDDPAKDGWLAKTHYFPAPPNYKSDWLPDTLLWLIQQKALRGKSIGFMPLVAHSPIPSEIKRRPDWADARLIFDEYAIIEYAVATIPSSPDSLVQAVSKGKTKGLNFPSVLMEGMGFIVPDDTSLCDLLKEVEVEEEEIPRVDLKGCRTADDVRASMLKALRLKN